MTFFRGLPAGVLWSIPYGGIMGDGPRELAVHGGAHDNPSG